MAGFQLQFIDKLEEVPFRITKSREIVDFWQALRGGGPVPRAEDINPGTMKSLLPEILNCPTTDRCATGSRAHKPSNVWASSPRA